MEYDEEVELEEVEDLEIAALAASARPYESSTEEEGETSEDSESDEVRDALWQSDKYAEVWTGLIELVGTFVVRSKHCRKHCKGCQRVRP